METQMINHPRLRVWHETGSEGPTYDPYHYDEYTVETPAGRTVLHTGLGTWLTHNDWKIEPEYGPGYKASESELVASVFPRLTGWSLEEIEKINRKRKSRCHNCGASAKFFYDAGGHPGEHRTACGGCHAIVDSYFCESEIM